MATLPVTLPAGYIIVYGDNITSSSGITPDNINFRFGSIYQIWDGGAPFVYGGDLIMYNVNDVTVRLTYGSAAQYNMMPARLVTKEVIPL